MKSASEATAATHTIIMADSPSARSSSPGPNVGAAPPRAAWSANLTAAPSAASDSSALTHPTSARYGRIDAASAAAMSEGKSRRRKFIFKTEKGGVGSGDWGIGKRKTTSFPILPTPHSPLPTPSQCLS
jgi:hypothetical protein